MASIQEVAEQLGVSTHALRYYEKEGLIAVPRDADIRTILSNPHDHALSIEVMERARVKIENEILGLQLNLEHLDRRIQEHRRQLDDAA